MKSIRWKLMLSFGAVAILALAASTGVFAGLYNRNLRHAELAELRILSRDIAVLVQDYAGSSQSESRITQYIQAASDYEGASIELLRSNGASVFRIDPNAETEAREAQNQLEAPGFPRGLPPMPMSPGPSSGHMAQSRMSNRTAPRRFQMEDVPRGSSYYPGIKTMVPMDDEMPLNLFVFRESRLSDRFLQDALRVLSLSALAALGLSLAAGYFFGSKMGEPIVHLRNQAGNIARGNYNTRAEVSGNDETAELARSFNAMADHLENHIEQLQYQRDTLQRFLEDASHELRTPLTNIMTSNEVLQDQLGKGLMIEDERLLRMFESNGHSLNIMKNLLDGLLSMSRIQSQGEHLPIERIDLQELCNTIIEARSSREERIELRVLGEPVPVTLARSSALQLMQNFIENAANAGAHTITLQTLSEADRVRVCLADDGPGLSADELQASLRRFAKGRNSTGSGLGLAICDEIVRLEGSELILSSPGELASGLEISFHLKKAPI